MTSNQVVLRVITALEQQGVPYMLVGHSRPTHTTRQPFLNAATYLPTAEDVIIQKLRWFERSRRVKDLEDAKGVVATQVPNLDFEYIRQWADKHGTRELFEKVLAESNPPS